jgi:acyl-CoA reductase-like NAD-dependent aldehyde dehydrogenase
MVTTLRTQGSARPAETFDTLNPATSEVIESFPVFGEDDVAETVEAARQAAAWWAGLPWKERRTRLLAWKSHVTRYLGRLAELVHNETGKPLADAQLEILLAIVHIDWAARNAHKVLRPRRVRSGLVALNQAATLEYQPLGVIGVIGPWNYPVFTPMGSIAYALAAGNAVVFKPSELTPAVGAWLVNSFAEVVPEQPVLQLITGAGPTGEHLARSGVSKIAFTGSAATAKKVMAACRTSPRWSPSAAARTRSSWPMTPTSTRRRTPPLGARCPTAARPASASSASTWWKASTTRSWRS